MCPESKWKFVDHIVTVVTPGEEGGIDKGGINGDLVCHFVWFYGLNILLWDFYKIISYKIADFQSLWLIKIAILCSSRKMQAEVFRMTIYEYIVLRRQKYVKWI